AEAKTELEAALKQSPGFPEARYNMGMLFMMEKRFAEARREFGAALRLNPRDRKLQAAVKKASAAVAAETGKAPGKTATPGKGNRPLIR
ncbi:MAG: tetratricopeptide repeat protein, partial [Syntrophales bacterium LBB04]|nr:tetratricopeptide repeat protein [Syntrophales bacterium LBB04]